MVLPASEDEVEFAAMVVAPPAADKTAAAESVGIIMGAVTIRLEGGASAERIAAIVPALTGPA